MRAALFVALLALGAVCVAAQAMPPSIHKASQTGVTTCPAGQGVTPSKGCAPCVKGYYKATAGLWGCVPCPVGTWSLEGGDKCNYCPDGYASPGALGGCNECEQGMWAQEYDKYLWNRPAGSYTRVSPMAACLPCPAGYYQPEIKQGACIKCQNGYDSREGAAQCTSGNFVNGNSAVVPPTPAKPASSSSSSSSNSGYSSSSYSGGSGSYGSEGYARLAQAGIKMRFAEADKPNGGKAAAAAGPPKKGSVKHRPAKEAPKPPVIRKANYKHSTAKAKREAKKIQ